MIIQKGKQLQFKAGSGHWKEAIAREDFDTANEYWNLQILDSETGRWVEFTPKGALCKLREPKIEGKKQKLIFDKRDIDIWQEINNKISQSYVKRYPWNLLLGDTLTKTILRQKMLGKTAQETYDLITNGENFIKIKQAFPEHAKKMEQNIFISVCARFGENNTALKLYRKEFQGESK